MRSTLLWLKALKLPAHLELPFQAVEQPQEKSLHVCWVLYQTNIAELKKNFANLS